MSDRLKQSGHYTLTSFVITSFDKKVSVDVSRIIYEFRIIESMSFGSVRGNASIFDAADLLNNFPLKGEETIEITYTDYFDRERTEHMVLYSISDTKYQEKNNALTSFTIHFVSVGKFYSDNKLISKAYRNGTIADFVQNVYTENYTNDFDVKPLLLENTDTVQSLIIPKLTPEQTMNFLARRAFTSVNKSQTFRFFENRDRYCFATNDEMIDQAKGSVGYGEGLVDPGLASAANLEAKTIPVFRLNFESENSPERQLQRMYEIIDIQIPLLVNSIEDRNSGAYYRTMYEMDVLNSSIIKTEYDHRSAILKEQTLLHPEKYAEENLNRPFDRYIIKDYSAGGSNAAGLRTYPHYLENYSNKSATFYHYRQNTLKVKIYGRNDLVAGSLIELDILKQIPGSNIERDEVRSGRYLIEQSESLFHENIYVQLLTLSADAKE